MRRFVFFATSLGLLLSGPLACFEKGSGSGSRATRPAFNSKGDIFLPGPGGKPGGEKDPEGTDPTKDPVMDPEATANLAECFNIPEEEIEAVVGWTGDASVAATAALCADLETVKYGGGTIINDADAVAFVEEE